jgi:GNAT superfamily N-acetyltransferase
MFATGSLASRIERAECTMLSELARAAASRLGRGEVVVAEIGGGVAVYTGHDSPANKLAGLGFADPPSPAELEDVEDAFALRHATLQVEFASLGDPAIPRMLSKRGYELIGFENVLGLHLDPTRLQAHDDPSVTVQHAGAGDTTTWMDAVATGFLHPDAFDGPPSHESYGRDAIERIFADTFATPSFERFIARLDGVVAGGASLRIHEGVAQLAGGATLPQYRLRGVQSALLHHRLLEATQRGCDVAVVTTQPGSKSTENAQRFGFSVLYVRAILVRGTRG